MQIETQVDLITCRPWKECPACSVPSSLDWTAGKKRNFLLLHKSEKLSVLGFLVSLGRLSELVVLIQTWGVLWIWVCVGSQSTCSSAYIGELLSSARARGSCCPFLISYGTLLTGIETLQQCFIAPIFINFYSAIRVTFLRQTKGKFLKVFAAFLCSIWWKIFYTFVIGKNKPGCKSFF